MVSSLKVPIIKDTLNVKPGEIYKIAFLADNPGNWLFHCHDLHHASNGMTMLVKYNNFDDFYKDTGKVDDKLNKNIVECKSCFDLKYHVYFA